MFCGIYGKREQYKIWGSNFLVCPILPPPFYYYYYYYYYYSCYQYFYIYLNNTLRASVPSAADVFPNILNSSASSADDVFPKHIT